MKAQLHLADPEDALRLLPMVARFHEETGIASNAPDLEAAIAPMLDGSPHGAAYLIGPSRAPVGYLVVSFGWSVEFGGLDGIPDELFIRTGVRGRGIAGDALSALVRALGPAGLCALHLEVRRTDEATKRLCRRAGFALRDDFALMSRDLATAEVAQQPSPP